MARGSRFVILIAYIVKNTSLTEVHTGVQILILVHQELNTALKSINLLLETVELGVLTHALLLGERVVVGDGGLTGFGITSDGRYGSFTRVQLGPFLFTSFLN